MKQHTALEAAVLEVMRLTRDTQTPLLCIFSNNPNEIPSVISTGDIVDFQAMFLRAIGHIQTNLPPEEREEFFNSFIAGIEGMKAAVANRGTEEPKTEEPT